jgi:hypothetical protein
VEERCSTILSPGLRKALNMALRSLPSIALFISFKANITENDHVFDFIKEYKSLLIKSFEHPQQ